jgi:hypothetical protein
MSKWHRRRAKNTHEGGRKARGVTVKVQGNRDVEKFLWAQVGHRMGTKYCTIVLNIENGRDKKVNRQGGILTTT